MDNLTFIREIRARLSSIETEIDELREFVDRAEAQLKTEESRVVEKPVVEKPATEPKPVEPEQVVLEPIEVVPAHNVDARLIRDLRKVIGLNDRIRFQKELFGGDASLMNSTIDFLNDVSSYIEALEYIAENFNWDDENETVKYFKDILSRKAY